MNTTPEPYCSIVEQPAPKSQRFRYGCESRAASIPGINSTADLRTYPTIQIHNFIGEVAVVVSCVSKDSPHRPHPNQFMGDTDDAKYGYKSLKAKITDTYNTIQFDDIGIKCVKKTDAKESLTLRQSKRVDPFKTGFAHIERAQNIDLKVLRLCFQVFLRLPKTPNSPSPNLKPLPPVVSIPIFDKRHFFDMNISHISDSFGTAAGGKTIMIFCEKVNKLDIGVRFSERVAGKEIWSALADPNTQTVHHQVAIAFRTPPYRNPELGEPSKNVTLQLYRPSDGAEGCPIKFTFTPSSVIDNNVSKSQSMKRKRPREHQSREEAKPLNADLENSNTKNANTPTFNKPNKNVADLQLNINCLPSTDFEDQIPYQPKSMPNNNDLPPSNNTPATVSTNPFLCDDYGGNNDYYVATNTPDDEPAIFRANNGKDYQVLSTVGPQALQTYNSNNPFLRDLDRADGAPPTIFEQTLNSLNSKSHLPVLDINSNELPCKNTNDAAQNDNSKAIDDPNVLSQMTVSFNSLTM